MLSSRTHVSLHVVYGQYYLSDGECDEAPVAVDTGGTGLIGVHDDRAFVVSGTDTGTIALTFEVHDAEPERDFDEWDDVVDDAMDLLSGRVCVDEWNGGQPVVVELPETDDTYLVRASVRGRDGERPEVHRIAVWPGFMIDAPVIWRGRDAKGAYWRHADNRRQARTVDVRDPTPRQYVEYDHYGPRDGLTGLVHRMNLPVYAAPGVAVTFVGFTTYPTGCMLRLNVTVTREGLDQAQWERRGYVCRAGFAAGLRLSFACPGEPMVISALRPESPAEHPVGPMLTGYWFGATVFPEWVDGQHQAWRWLRPGHPEWRLAVQWPDLGIPSTEFTVEGADPNQPI